MFPRRQIKVIAGTSEGEVKCPSEGVKNDDRTVKTAPGQSNY